jgi:hypothetical protein
MLGNKTDYTKQRPLKNTGDISLAIQDVPPFIETSDS